tara:strand:+ start:444 stop:689 length:246 start_codon:yes stop_codon:yes gene_type:complete
MQLENDNSAMELTSEQVWSLLREELVVGLDSGELTEEEFATELKTLRTVVDNTIFTLVAEPITNNAEEQDNGGPNGQEEKV